MNAACNMHCTTCSRAGRPLPPELRYSTGPKGVKCTSASTFPSLHAIKLRFTTKCQDWKTCSGYDICFGIILKLSANPCLVREAEMHSILGSYSQHWCASHLSSPATILRVIFVVFTISKNMPESESNLRLWGPCTSSISYILHNTFPTPCV